MSIESENCLICGEPAEYVGIAKIGNLRTINNQCRECGIIHFARDAENMYEGDDGWKFRACLYYYFTQMKKRNNKPYLILDQKNITEKANHDKYNIISIQEIMNVYPRNFSERIDKILLNLEYLSDGVGANIIIDFCASISNKLFFIKEEGGSALRISAIYDILESNGFTKTVISYARGEKAITILSKGWNRIDELHKDNDVLMKAFIAMCFDEDLKDVREAIKGAIDGTGYLIDILLEKEHNNEIMPEVYYGIRTSDFVVADLTHNRGGVYLEAGYALGLGKEVIFTVNENLLKKEDGSPNYDELPHFDVAQRNQIRYKDTIDLKEKLIKRITATVGNLKENK